MLFVNVTEVQKYLEPSLLLRYFFRTAARGGDLASAGECLARVMSIYFPIAPKSLMLTQESCAIAKMTAGCAEVDLSMFSMFSRTGAPQKRGPHTRTSMNCCNMLEKSF